MTIKDLKELIKDWPEIDSNGLPTEVWLESGDMLSSACMQYSKLNVRTKEDGTDCYDLLLEFTDDHYWEDRLTIPFN